MRSILLLVALSSVLSAQSAKSAAAAKGPALRNLLQSDLPAVTPRVKVLRADPATLTLRVGQTVELDSIHLVAIDGTSQPIGRLMAFDFGIQPGQAATAVPRKVTGVRAGTSELALRYSRTAWGSRPEPRPFAIVKIVVKP